MQICQCFYPIVTPHANGTDKYCSRCGHWWVAGQSFEPGSRVVPRLRAFRIGRNDPCPCGSKLKFKKCCLNPAGANSNSKEADLTPPKTPAEFFRKGNYKT